jgi:DNA invertase Pin-like site-specific DNA recombinase
LSTLLELAQPGDCLVVERLDRLARDLMIQEVILKECRERQVKVYAADQPEFVDMASNHGDPTRILIRQIMGALAQWEKNCTVRKLRIAREKKSVALGRCCTAQLPYGSTPEEAKIKRHIQALKERGFSFAEVAEALNNARFKTRRGKRWNKDNVFTVFSERKLKPRKPSQYATTEIICAEPIPNICLEQAPEPQPSNAPAP